MNPDQKHCIRYYVILEQTHLHRYYTCEGTLVQKTINNNKPVEEETCLIMTI
jgi:hypothetical protein